ncbi:MAG: SgcJ/EcaC family oxidoreductase [Pseudonocardiales bacterium]|nr:SgcJ/EcaC family oxidoreductase [Pseudonocardiales bacterium]
MTTTAEKTGAEEGVTDARTIAVSALPARIIAAWTAHDADAFAAVFHADATMILPGAYAKGREAIREYMAGAFAGQYRGSQVTGQPISLEFFGEDTAVLVSQGGVMAAGQNKVSPAGAVRATWVATRDADGTWRLAAYQNSPLHG